MPSIYTYVVNKVYKVSIEVYGTLTLERVKAKTEKVAHVRYLRDRTN